MTQADRGEWAEAVGVFGALADELPQWVELRVNLANCLCEQGDAELARRHYREARPDCVTGCPGHMRQVCHRLPSSRALSVECLGRSHARTRP